MSSASPTDGGTADPLGPRPFGVPGGVVRGDRVRIQAHFLAEVGEQRTDIGIERVVERAVRAQDIAGVLEGLGRSFLDVHHRADLGFYFVFDVVALVEHESHPRARLVRSYGYNLEENA